MYKTLDDHCAPGVQDGMNLSDYMRDNDLNDEAFAAVIGRSRATVSRIRRSRVRPDWATLALIKTATDGAVTPDDFLEPAPTEQREAVHG